MPRPCSSRLSSSVRFLILRVPARGDDCFLTVVVFVGLIDFAYDTTLLRRAPSERLGRKQISRPLRVSSTP